MEIIMATKFGSSCAKLLLLVCLVFGCFVEVLLGRTYTVGDRFGWQTPPNGAATFTNWANQHAFVVGDILEFNFNTGVHTATRVNKNAYDSCNAANPIDNETNGPAKFTLNTTGDYYFICTTHCDQGQKLTVNVTSTGSPSGSPSPGSSPGTPGGGSSSSPPPSPSGSVSTRVATAASFGIILVSIIVISVLLP